MLGHSIRSMSAAIVLGVAFGGTTLPAADKGEAKHGVCIEARLVRHRPGEKPSVLSSFKCTTSFGGAVFLHIVEERHHPSSHQIPEAPAKPATPPADQPEVRIRVAGTAKLRNDGVLLAGRATITDTPGVAKTPPPKAGPAASRPAQTVVVPFSLILTPGGKFVALPVAKGRDKSRKRELQVRVTLVDFEAERLEPRGIDWGER